MPDTAGTQIPVCPLAELEPGAMRLIEHDGIKIGGGADADPGSCGLGQEGGAPNAAFAA